jgi:hypothetical protein
MAGHQDGRLGLWESAAVTGRRTEVSPSIEPTAPISRLGFYRGMNLATVEVIYEREKGSASTDFEKVHGRTPRTVSILADRCTSSSAYQFLNKDDHPPAAGLDVLLNSDRDRPWPQI